MKAHTRSLVFSVWGWLALPLLVGAVLLSFSAGLHFGVAFVVLTGGWLYHMGSTACSRCGFYGTGRCGVQAWGVAWLWRKQPAGSVSRRRIRLHSFFDIVMMAAGVAAYVQCPVLLPLFLSWAVVGWLVVYGPNRYHGLLHRLPAQREPANQSLLSLPVLSGPANDLSNRGLSSSDPSMGVSKKGFE